MAEQDTSVRIDFTETAQEVIYVVWFFDQDGQISLVDTGEIGPFDSIFDTFREIARALVRAAVVRTL